MRSYLLPIALGVVLAAALVYEATQRAQPATVSMPSIVNPFESSAEVPPELIRKTFDGAHDKALDLVERSNRFRIAAMITDGIGFLASILVTLLAVRLGLVAGPSDATKAVADLEARIQQEAAASGAPTTAGEGASNPAPPVDTAAAKEAERRKQKTLTHIKYLAAVSAILIAVSARFTNAADARAARANTLQTEVASQRRDFANTTKSDEALDILRKVDLIVKRAN